MSLRALLYAYVLGGITFIPLLILGAICYTIYTSVPVGEGEAISDGSAKTEHVTTSQEPDDAASEPLTSPLPPSEVNDLPRTKKGWLTMRRTFEELTFDASYVTLVRSFMDARSRDPKRSRPKDMWYVVLKGKVLYLYEDESQTECEVAIELGGHVVSIYPDEGLLDGELFTKRNAICLKPRTADINVVLSATEEIKPGDGSIDQKVEEVGSGSSKEKEKSGEEENKRDTVREEASKTSVPWFIFVRSCVEMEDWYFSLLHASEHPANTPTLNPLQGVFLPSEMNHLVTTLDEQPDVIPMRWLNALIGRVFFSFYRTQLLESYIIGRLMKKLSKVKRPTFLSDIVVTQFSVGNKPPTLSKPMLKELTKEGDAALEVRLSYKGEVRATVEATAVINLGARFKSYTVKLVLAVVLRELEGNLLIKVKRPPSSRIWYAFTQKPRMVLDVEPIVSDRQITWSMILNTIESKLIEVIQESVVMPNMDDISFFDSSQYEHRGGIWSDSSRRAEPSPESTPPSPEEDNAISAPEAPPAPETAVEAQPLSLERSQSADELTSDISPLDAVPAVARAASTTTPSEGISKAAKRRSWFASIRGESPEVANDQLDIEEAVESDTSRGRRSTTETATVQPDTPTELPAAYYAEELDTHEPSELLSPQYRRSSSQHSQARSRPSRTHSVSSSAGGDDSSSYYLSDSGSSKSTPRSATATPTTASSFLSTLKSKAGDKQAFSNSAKEAMRKWGVNWGGLKKEKDNNATSTPDEVPDVGPPDHATRTESNNLSPRTRPTYAEVRAAVAERKEREKPSHQEDEHPAAPIDIPIRQRGKARSTSISGDQSPSFSDDGSSSSKIPSGSSEGPSSQKRASMSHAGGDIGSGDLSREPRLTEASDGIRNSSPIHTQPAQARSMIIPGIHASHRGEVMSMGYVAPSSSPPENKSKAPAIQSVYRLWKSPILSGQQPVTEGSSVSPPETGERNKDVAPLSLSPEAAPVVPLLRPIPPPLPPRTMPTRPVPDTPKTAESVRTEGSSLESEAVKWIVTQDEMSPAQPSDPSPDEDAAGGDTNEEGMKAIPTSPASKPPLPPRRIQTSAD